MRISQLLFIFVVLCFMLSCKRNSSSPDYSTWHTYVGSKDGNRYSSNTQITLSNVSSLKIAWTYSSHDRDTGNRSQNQCNPIMVDGMLYATSPKLKLFALDAVTGEQKWLFDPATQEGPKKGDPLIYYKVCRGLVYWEDGSGDNKRIFYSVGEKTYAIDAGTGLPVKSFGKGGYIDLTENLGRKVNSFVSGTTPGVIYKDLLILGDRVSESEDAAPGHI